MMDARRIGERIRNLRKEQGLSQEQLALDLGMYQADISNLERAQNGSGINDLSKLEAISAYFGISLEEFLFGVSDSSHGIVTGIPTARKYSWEKYRVADIQAVADENEFEEYAFSELKLTSPVGRNIYFSFSYRMGYDPDDPELCFRKSGKTLFGLFPLARQYENAGELLKKTCVFTGTDYLDFYDKMDSEWLDICRILINAAEAPEDESLQQMKGKMLSEIEIRIPCSEPKDLVEIDYSDLSEVFRQRLITEAFIENPHVYAECENGARMDQARLKRLKAACVSEDAYMVWKKDLLDLKVAEAKKYHSFLACKYIFAGIGQYTEIILEEELPCFLCWIDRSGSAFFGSSAPATSAQIRNYVAKHIADDLLPKSEDVCKSAECEAYELYKKGYRLYDGQMVYCSQQQGNPLAPD